MVDQISSSNAPRFVLGGTWKSLIFFASSFSSSGAFSSKRRRMPFFAKERPLGNEWKNCEKNHKTSTTLRTLSGKKTSLGWFWDDVGMIYRYSSCCTMYLVCAARASELTDDQKLPKVCAKPSKTHILACKRRVTPRKANSPATSQSFPYIKYKKNQNDQQTYNQDHTQIHLLHLSSWCNYDNVRCSPLNDPKDNQPMRRSSY